MIEPRELLFEWFGECHGMLSSAKAPVNSRPVPERLEASDLAGRHGSRSRFTDSLIRRSEESGFESTVRKVGIGRITWMTFPTRPRRGCR